MANKLKGDEVRVVISARAEPSKKQLLIDEYGSVQLAVEYAIKQAEKRNNNKKTKKTKKKVKV